MIPAGAALAAALLFAPIGAETSANGVTVRHAAAAAAEARDLLSIAPQVQRDLLDRLGLVLPAEYVVELALDRAEFEARAGAEVERWAAGVAFPREARLAIRLDAVAPHAGATLREVFRHEATHLAFGSLPARVPRWFEEGVSQWFTGKLVLGDPDELAIAYRLGQVHRFSLLVDAFPSEERSAALAYAQSESIVRHLVDRFGQVGLRGLIAEFGRRGDFKEAVIAALGVPLIDIEVSWEEEQKGRGPLAYLLVKSIPLFAFVALLVVLGFIRARWRRGRMLERFDAESVASGGDDVAAPEDGDERA
jgi:hypothetical protein